LQTSSVHLQTSSVHLQTSSVPLKGSSVPLEASSVPLLTDSERMARLEEIARPVRESGKVSREVMVNTILTVCNDDFLNLKALADLLNRSPNSLRIKHLNRMVKEGQLELRHPGKPTHPDQGYRAKKQEGRI
jgi:ATP-dependent DNA helicase RecG